MRSTRPRKPAEISTHDWHHRIIEEDLAAYRALPKTRSGLARKRRIEASKTAWHSLTGHMRQFHGLRSSIGKTYVEMAALHERMHAESQTRD